MGSSTITDSITMAEDKKNPIKSIIKNFKCKFGLKKEKEQKTHDTKVHKKEITKQEIQHKKPEVKVEDVLENFRKLEIEKRKESKKREEEDEFKNFSFKTAINNEHDNFTYKVVEEDRNRTESFQSTSSQDSGFSEKDEDQSEILKVDDDVIKRDDDKNTEEVKNTNNSQEGEEQTKKEQEQTKKEEEVIVSLQNLNLEDGKKKKAQLVPVSRGPVRHRAGDLAGTCHPYRLDTQINTTINKHTFSGGQVIVANRSQEFIPFSDQNAELQNFANNLESRGVILDENPKYDLEDIQDLIDEDQSAEDILKDFLKDPNCSQHLDTITTLVERIEEQQNPIEELENTNHLNYEKIENLDSLLGFHQAGNVFTAETAYAVDNPYTAMYPTPPSAEIAHSPSSNEFYSNFLTPPRSDLGMPSPMSDSIYPSGSDCVLSPNSDCEKYQEILQNYDDAILPDEILNLEDEKDKKRERNISTSSLTMKNFKDMQKELTNSFSDKECCQMNRKACKEAFQEHLKSLKAEERRSMCLKVAAMDLKTIYGVLHHILLGLSSGAVDEALHLSLFALLCEKALNTKSQAFLEDFGLELLKAASLRCPKRPLLVRYLVNCIRIAIKQNPALVEGKEYVFKEVDAQGDTLVTACARAGDAYADVLAELVRREHGQMALFNVQHVNTEGYSALHVACREHSESSPHLHTVHVLLEHGGADIWKGDVKGGDTAVHMSVNSAHCALKLVLLLFKHLDRKQWKALAHAHNRSSVTPLDYARCAAKSASRTDYPAEVLEFLKKCR